MEGLEKIKTIWIHGSSIGEILSAKTLIEEIKKQYPTLQILITTNTESSKKIILERFKIDFSHIFLPIMPYKILSKYKPDMVLWVESDFIPWYLFVIKKAKIPFYLVNARMSNKSFRRWKLFKFFLTKMLKSFTHIFPQSSYDLNKFNYFISNKTDSLGNLKFSNISLSPIHNHYKFHKYLLVCNSTHKNEEAKILDYFDEKQQKNTTLVIIPRHIKRVKKIENLIKKKKINYELWSKAKKLENINEATSIILVDGNGFNNFFCSIASAVFIGKTISDYTEGGQNPIEPLLYGKPILYGNKFSNFYDISNDLICNQIGYLIEHESQIFIMFEKLMQDINLQNDIKENSIKYLRQEKKVLNNYLDFLIPKINQILGE